MATIRDLDGLNPALQSYRRGVNARFPNRGLASDGGKADKLHSSTSQHQEDPDGTVDALDLDVNLLGSSRPQGTREEDRLFQALLRDFEADPRAHLWIHDREIAQHNVRDWEQRYYGGDNPHDQHGHLEAKQSRERDGRPWKFTHTDRLLEQLADEQEWDMDAKQMQEFADLIGKATARELLNGAVKVGDDPWKFSTAIGYIARKAYEIDGTLDQAVAEQPAVETGAADAPTPSPPAKAAPRPVTSSAATAGPLRVGPRHLSRPHTCSGARPAGTTQQPPAVTAGGCCVRWYSLTGASEPARGL